MSGEEVAKLFYNKGVTQSLSDNYEVLHTQSHQWLIEEIDDFIERHHTR